MQVMCHIIAYFFGMLSKHVFFFTLFIKEEVERVKSGSSALLPIHTVTHIPIWELLSTLLARCSLEWCVLIVAGMVAEGERVLLGSDS